MYENHVSIVFFSNPSQGRLVTKQKTLFDLHIIIRNIIITRDAPIDRLVTGIGRFSYDDRRPAGESEICRFYASFKHSCAA